jgi:hypothetical protein
LAASDLAPAFQRERSAGCGAHFRADGRP